MKLQVASALGWKSKQPLMFYYWQKIERRASCSCKRQQSVLRAAETTQLSAVHAHGLKTRWAAAAVASGPHCLRLRYVPKTYGNWDAAIRPDSEASGSISSITTGFVLRKRQYKARRSVVTLGHYSAGAPLFAEEPLQGHRRSKRRLGFVRERWRHIRLPDGPETTLAIGLI